MMRPFGTSGSDQVSWTDEAVTLSTTAGLRFNGRSVDVVREMEGPRVQPADVHASTYTSYVVYASSCCNSTSREDELIAYAHKQHTKLDGQGKARREAARRRNSECKINLSCRNSSRGNDSRPTAQR